MHRVQVGTGRLLEVRIEPPFETEDVKALEESIRAAVQRSPGVRLIGCADMRKASVFTQDVVQALIELFRIDNAMFERSALFISTSAVFSMQIERMVRAAGNPQRRTFRDAQEGVVWLAEKLDAEERAALHRFIQP